jgi:hypothetical protein
VTGAEFSGVDIDLLADYVGGALDGTPDEAVVTALIAEDAAWRDAHALLSDGVATVTGHLQDLGAVDEPMPADVSARLDAALLAQTTGPESRATAVGASADGSGAPAAMEPGTDGAAPVRHLVAVASSGSRSKRARRLRWAAPVGIAAGVLAFIGFGVQQLGSTDAGQDTSAASSAEDNSAQAAAGDALALPGGIVPVSNSGIDYRRDTLGQVTITTLATGAPAAPSASSFKQAPGTAPRNALDESALARLRVQEALKACIDAIAAQQGAGEITAQSVDFARFEGAPAVIVQFSTANATWVWAAGPDCGSPGVGADKLASVQVG